ASLARAGHRTLLLDGDVRLPAVHRLFEMPDAPGFCELLRGEVSLEEATRPTRVEGLWAVAAGRPDPRAFQALAQPTFQSILEVLRQQFDYVVVDSAPVLPVVDSLLLGQHADGVVFSVLRGTSQAPAVHAAYQRMAELNIRMLGVVFSGADLHSE